MISYAQAREDVFLHRALRGVHHDDGFYIDVGGFDPDHDSVTRHFYDHGWRGINVEPGEHRFPRFLECRPRDINLQVAVTDRSGEVTFHELENEQLCTLEDRFADRHAATGMTKRSYTVPAMTLTQICEQHAPKEIHFLKIDVEGHEAAVIRGMDFSRFRPWVLVIEATEPNNLNAPTYHEWDDMVIAAGYEFMCTDILNRYYVAKEHPELFRRCGTPADDFVYAHHVYEINHLKAALEQQQQRIRDLELLLAEKPVSIERAGI